MTISHRRGLPDIRHGSIASVLQNR